MTSDLKRTIVPRQILISLLQVARQGSQLGVLMLKLGGLRRGHRSALVPGQVAFKRFMLFKEIHESLLEDVDLLDLADFGVDESNFGLEVVFLLLPRRAFGLELGDAASEEGWQVGARRRC